MHKHVPENEIPERLGRLQFVRFDTGRALTRSIAELAEALRVDIDWIREHTRLGELATRWNARGRPESLLLRGDEQRPGRTGLLPHGRPHQDPADLVFPRLAGPPRARPRRLAALAAAVHSRIGAGDQHNAALLSTLSEALVEFAMRHRS